MEENSKAPTPQKNEPLWTESIYILSRRRSSRTTNRTGSGIFTELYDTLFDITRLAYTQMLADNDHLNRKMTLKMLNYYVIVMRTVTTFTKRCRHEAYLGIYWWLQHRWIYRYCPSHTEATRNLLGYTGLMGPRRD